MVSPLRHEEIPKDVNFMICGADLLRYPHSCRILQFIPHFVSFGVLEQVSCVFYQVSTSSWKVGVRPYSPLFITIPVVNNLETIVDDH